MVEIDDVEKSTDGTKTHFINSNRNDPKEDNRRYRYNHDSPHSPASPDSPFSPDSPESPASPDSPDSPETPQFYRNRRHNRDYDF